MIALSTKDAHVNAFGSGGDVICADVRPIELSVAGFPGVDDVLEVSVQGGGTHTQVAVASALGDSLTPYGASQLDFGSLKRLTPMIPMPATGVTRSATVPHSAAIVGAPLHFQAALVDAFSGIGYLSNRVSIRVQP